MSDTTDTTAIETETDTTVIVDETPTAPTSKKGKRKAKATSVELQDVSQEKDEPATEEAEVTAVEELPAVEYTEKAVASRPLTLEEKILAIAPGTPARTLLRALHVNKTGGTAAITTAGTLVFLPSHAPEKGGKQTLSRSGRIRAFVADL